LPELPDIVVYLEAIKQRIEGQTLEQVEIASPFLLRTALPPITRVEGRRVIELRRLGKRICIGLEEDLWLVLHLMIAGRLHWRDRGPVPHGAGRVSQKGPPKLSRSPKNPGLAGFQFSNGTLLLTEAGSQRRASLHLVEGAAGLKSLDPGGVEIYEINLEGFAKVLTSANHTLKRALTDPRLFSGIGNAYSDEILFHAQLSPVALTQKLTPEQIERLFKATRATLTDWVERLRAEVSQPADVTRTVGSRRAAPGGSVKKRSPSVREGLGRSILPEATTIEIPTALLRFPEKVTAFRSGMAVHGRYKQPCPRCHAKIQRIRYASNETDYCPNCQTGGRLLADRSLSRLLRSDWPRTIDELEGLTQKR